MKRRISMRIHFLQLPNKELISQTKSLVRSATEIEVQILYRLDEICTRKIPVDMGFGSLNEFCVAVLGMTKDQAAKRMAALTNTRAWPELLYMLETDAISLTVANMVGPKLTQA